MADVLVSVIVPVYNVEKLIKPSVEAMLRQTYKNYELILVDDCSADRSGAICDEYAQKNRRVKVIHKEKNEGTGYARNTGMDAAKGKYIYFCDPDDTLYNNLLEDNVALAEEYGADMVVFGCECYKKMGDRMEFDYASVPKISGAYDNKGFWDNFEAECGTISSIWNRLFRRDFMYEHNIRSTNVSTGQDALFLYDIYEAGLQKVVYNQEIYYRYIVRTGSATNIYRKEWLDNVFRIVKRLDEVVTGLEGDGEKYRWIVDREYVKSADWGLRMLCGVKGVSAFKLAREMKAFMNRPEMKKAYDSINIRELKGFRRKVRTYVIKKNHFLGFILGTRVYRVLKKHL